MVTVVASSTAIAISTTTAVPPVPATEIGASFPTSTPIPPPTIAAAETPGGSEPPATLLPELTSEPVIDALAPGQQATGQLAGGDFESYAYQGKQFQPVMIFVEASEELDVVVAAYEGIMVPHSNLDGLTLLSQAAFNPAGRPELLVFTPNRDGEFIIVVSGQSGTSGAYVVYMYDGTTPAENTQLFNDALAAGETKSYLAVSNGGRPVIAFVDQSDQSNMVIEILNQKGTVVSEANYGGTGSAEASFVLPLDTTSYTVRISEASGAPARYNLAIVTLD
jgi:hypothetical protein